MKKSMRNIARAMVEVLHDKSPKEVESGMKDAVKYLAERGLLTRWRELERDIHSVWKEKFGTSKITILTAHALSEKTYKVLEEFAPGAQIMEHVDDRLIGGAIIRVDDRRLDGSIIGALQRLKNTLLE